MTRLLDARGAPTAIAVAAEVIRHGGLVAFPTETVYGLGANAFDAAAVAKIFAVKDRVLSDPLIVHVDLDGAATSAPFTLAGLVERQVLGALSARQEALARTLVRSFWPGPLTLVLPRGPRIPLIVTAGQDTVAVRMPDHPIALELIRRSGVPIAAPSANRFGHVSPTTAQHVLEDLGGRIDVVLDGGPTPIGIESTVLDLSVHPPRVLRPGGLVRAAIEAVIGPLRDRPATAEEPQPASLDSPQASPGLLRKHYAPRAQLRVVRTTSELIATREQLTSLGLRVGVLVRDAEQADCAALSPLFVLGPDLESVARNLYAALRAMDSAGVDVILVSAVEAQDLGEAIADRLQRGSASTP